MARLDQWVELEAPPDGVRLAATAWILTRFDDPYAGVRRARGFENLWFGPIPGSQYGGLLAVCSYWIVESEHRVRCDSFGSLSSPL